MSAAHDSRAHHRRERLGRAAAPLALAASALALVDVAAGLTSARYAVAYSWLHVASVTAAAAWTIWAVARRGEAVRAAIPLALLLGCQLPWSSVALRSLPAAAVLLPWLAALVAGAALAAVIAAAQSQISLRRAAPTEEPPQTAADGIAPGWYADPTDPAWMRWWDGTGWTASRRAAVT